jgi:HPt (histidine-containing phosphotransfer) domain-containing protein
MQSNPKPPCDDHPGLPGLDEAVLHHLLDLAGPVDGYELIRRLTGDLRAVAGNLAAGLAGDDLTVMHRQSHILIGVAGTIGAMHLHGMAVDLNRRAKDPANISAAHRLGERVVQELELLLPRIREIAHDREIDV